jgi:DNA-binding CsgD family transcriptional regulator
MLQSHHLSVLEAQDRESFLKEVVGFSRQLGFDRVGAMTVVDQPSGEPLFINLDNAPEAYRSSSAFRKEGKLDPVMQHCRRSSVPLIWGQSHYVASGLIDKWDYQATYGYAHGVAVAMHLPHGLHFMMGVNRDKPLPADAAETTRISAELQLFVVHAQEAALRVLVPAHTPQLDGQRPTRRELECLRWTMEGKTAWEIGRILDIAEHTAVRHLYNATRKLGAVGKHQAVLRAYRLGLIW